MSESDHNLVIVGNDLIANSHSEFIDSADIVVRVDGFFHSDNYKQNKVGSKTDIYSIIENTSLFDKIAEDLSILNTIQSFWIFKSNPPLTTTSPQIIFNYCHDNGINLNYLPTTHYLYSNSFANQSSNGVNGLYCFSCLTAEFSNNNITFIGFNDDVIKFLCNMNFASILN